MKTRNATKTRNANKLNSTNVTQRPALMRMLLAGSLLCTSGIAFAVATALVIPVPAPLDIGNYVSNQAAAVQLGKALFWDMQVGSDGVQACATCHFHAGADNRTRNQLNPKDEVFGNHTLGPSMPQPATGSMFVDQEVTPAHFPTHRLIDQHVIGEPLANSTNVVRDTNDVMGSMGLKRTIFNDIVIGSAVDAGTPDPDPVFTDGNENLRQVTGRNTPSAINAVFNFENFHDGRANNIFNGGNPFGPADPRQHLINNSTGSMVTEELRIRQSSLASQAVGPPMDGTEMSFIGRTFPKLGKKMLSLRPLAQQQVAQTDSVLGNLSQGAPGGTGLNTSYKTMIEAAFHPQYWNNTTDKVTFDANGIPSFSPGAAEPTDTNQFTQMEANFAFFWGLAIQMYESTLVANDSKFDQFILNGAGLNNEEILGMNLYNGDAGCILCHDGATLMDIDHAFIQGIDPLTDVPIPFNQDPLAANELMQIATGNALYDNGFHNTGVRPQGNPDPNAPDYLAVNEDIGRGATTSLGGGMTEISLSKGILGLQNQFGLTPLQTPGLAPLPDHVAAWVPELPIGFQPFQTTPFEGRVTNFGAFKTPSIRNLTLTGPYMHNGGLSTIRQIVDFYVRGGDFPRTNDQNFDSQGMTVLPLLTDAGTIPGDFTPEEKRDALVQFLMTLTDERVALEQAPFDHPELFVPVTGSAPMSLGSLVDGSDNRADFVADTTNFRQVAAVGTLGRQFGQPPLGEFLGLDPRSDGLVADADLDLIEDAADNCPAHANPGQEDVGDSDGVGDACDNCTMVANADQRDTDADGFGNICDGDLDNNLQTNLTDFSSVRTAFGTADPDADFNGDGTVNLTDFSLFRGMFGSAPGPSGLNP